MAREAQQRGTRTREDNRSARRRDREVRDHGTDDRELDRTERADRRHDRQAEAFGGSDWVASFFGWVVALGVGAILMALVTAAGAAIRLTEVSGDEATEAAESISLVGGILLIAVALVAYFAGGYVAGRMARFDGARQGVGAWAFGLIVAIVLAVVGAIFGTEYNLLGKLDLPRIPIDEGTLASGAVIGLIIALAASLIASMLGGKAGEAYHRRVDRV